MLNKIVAGSLLLSAAILWIRPYYIALTFAPSTIWTTAPTPTCDGANLFAQFRPICNNWCAYLNEEEKDVSFEDAITKYHPLKARCSNDKSYAMLARKFEKMCKACKNLHKYTIKETSNSRTFYNV